MARENYLLEELDPATIDALRTVKGAKGDGHAGIFFDTGDYGAGCLLIVGLCVIVGVFFWVYPPLNDPTNAAMLLTAGLWLGGWMVLAGLRIYVARSVGSDVGSFTYADPWRIWQIKGAKVEVVDIDRASGVQIFERRNNEGAYQDSTLTIESPEGNEKVILTKEVGAREIHAYIEFWVQARAGQTLTPAFAEQLAARAKSYAYDQDVTLDPALPVAIPKPEKVREASAGWLNVLLVAASGVALFFLLHPVVVAWRDDAIFEHVRRGPPRELRAYLVDVRNTRHRDEVKNLLAGRYAASIAAFKDRIRQDGDHKFAGIAEPMGELLDSVAVAPQPIISVRVKENVPPGNVADGARLLERPALVQKMVADVLLGAIGPDMLAVSQAPDDVSALIEVEYSVVPEKDQATVHLETKVAIRKSPDDEPLILQPWQSPSFLPERTNDNLRQFVKAFTGVAPVADPAPAWGFNGKLP